MTSCPKCQTELRETAKYCDCCGAPVDPQALPAATKTKVQSVNWPVLIIIVLVIAFGGWLLFGKGGNGSASVKPGTANPHAEGAPAKDGANPHTSSGGPMDDNMSQKIAEAKAKLEKDPLDTQALAYLYMTYGQVGYQSRLTTYLDAALAEVDKRKAELGDKAKDVVKQIAAAALNGGDLDGAFKALLKANKMDPADLSLVRLLGDLYGTVEKWQDSIAWFDKYMAQAKPEDHANYFAALLGLAVAYGKTGDTAKSKTYMDQAQAFAADDTERWRVESEKAKLAGKEPPPPPAGMQDKGASPHGGMGGSTGGGGMPPATPNPHGGMGAGG